MTGGPGAPPRAWGGRWSRGRFRRRRRSTPTCVGRTTGERSRCRGTSEHPHVRGEDRFGSCNIAPSYGAPPRAWGGHQADQDHTAECRSTPTCVGRTAQACPHRQPPLEHPHVRGEDVTMSAIFIAFTGAPPRAWGGQPAPGGERPVRRSTPTCVGRTQSTRDTTSCAKEHPHVRGEDTSRPAALPALRPDFFNRLLIGSRVFLWTHGDEGKAVEVHWAPSTLSRCP